MTTPVDPTASPPPRPWPAWYAFVTAWLRPAANTTRMAHLPLWKAFAVHVGAGMVAVVLGAGLDFGLYHARNNDRSVTEIVALAIQEAQSELESLYASPLDGLLAGLAVVGIELGVIAFAILLMPAGAAQEPVRDSMRHAVHRVWLHSTMVIPLLVVGFLADETLVTARWAESQEASLDCYAQFPSPARDPAAQAPTLAQREAWQKQWECREQHPCTTYAAIFDSARAVSVALLGVWCLWSLVRGLEAPRPARPVTYPPVCRLCGYNLSGVPSTGRCAECGTSISASLGENADPGSTWDRRAEFGRWLGFGDTLLEGLLRPRQLARQLRIVPVRRGYLCFAGLATLLMGTAPALIVLLIVRVGGPTQYLSVSDTFNLSALLGVGGIGAGIISIGLAANTAGWIAAAKARRNVFRGTLQLAVYMSGQLVLSVWLLAALIVASVVGEGVLRRIGGGFGWHPWWTFIVTIIVIAGFAAVLVVAYIVRVSLASAGLWYARR